MRRINTTPAKFTSSYTSASSFTKSTPLRKGKPHSRSCKGNSLPISFKFKPTHTESAKIIISSNWGDPNTVSLSGFTFFTASYQKPIITHIRTTPSSSHEDLLLGDDLFKTKDDEYWTAPMNQGEVTIEVKFVVQEPIDLIRIFNSPANPKTGARKVKVVLSNGMEAKGEVPQSFGTELRLYSAPQLELHQYFPVKPTRTIVTDNYGTYPLTQYNNLQIEVVSSYSNEKIFGISALEILDQNFKPLKIEDIQSFEIKNCKEFRSFRALFRDDKNKRDMDTMFVAVTNWEAHPIIEIRTKKYMSLAAINIYNYYEYEKSPDRGIKEIKIRANNRLIWNGIVSKAETVINEDIEPSRKISFCEPFVRHLPPPLPIPIPKLVI